MKTSFVSALCTTLATALLITPDASAQITRIDLQVVESPALDGQRFGLAGQYERLRGMAHGEVDPDDPRHRDIVNLDHAPRNGAGRVEYRTTIEIYRPVDMTRWNRALYHTVPNRGRTDVDPTLLDRGFALVQVGWQGDIAPTDRNIVPVLPVAKNPDGTSIVGPALEEFIFNDAESASRARLTYPAASLDPEQATLTVRRTQQAPRLPPPRSIVAVRERQGDPDRTPGRLRRGRHLRARLPRKRPDRDGARLCGDARRDLVPPLRRDRHRRQRKPARVRGSPTGRHLVWQLPERPRAQRLPLPGVQPGRRRPDRVRRHAPRHRGLTQDFHELPVLSARSVAKTTRGPRLPGRPVPVHLRDPDRPAQRPNGRTPGAVRRVEHLPEDHPQRW